MRVIYLKKEDGWHIQIRGAMPLTAPNMVAIKGPFSTRAEAVAVAEKVQKEIDEMKNIFETKIL